MLPRRTPASLRAALTEAVLELPGVEPGVSRFGGAAAFTVAGRELAHFHGDGELDLRLTRALIAAHRDRLAADPRARPRPRPSDWIAFSLRTPADVPALLSWIALAARAHVPA